MEVGDWRKNVEAMSGMQGRKKMFDAAGGAQWTNSFMCWRCRMDGGRFNERTLIESEKKLTKI